MWWKSEPIGRKQRRFKEWHIYSTTTGVLRSNPMDALFAILDLQKCAMEKRHAVDRRSFLVDIFENSRLIWVRKNQLTTSIQQEAFYRNYEVVIPGSFLEKLETTSKSDFIYTIVSKTDSNVGADIFSECLALRKKAWYLISMIVIYI